MDNGKDSFFTVEEFYQNKKKFLRLKEVIKKSGYSRKIVKLPSSKTFYPVQVWGKRENRYLKKLSVDRRREFLKKKADDDSCCIILTDNLSFFPEIKEEAKKIGLALFRSELSRKRCQEKIKKLFLSPDSVTISGGLLRIFGLGVLISGDSGIGKSESALELITRGHFFVADDVVQIKKNTNRKLIGKAPSLSRHIMEIRGLGFINIKKIFGLKSILPQTKIDLVINLKRWKQGKEYDRIGLKFSEDYLILGEKIPQVNIPVAPGRNIATLIEVACKVHKLREKGYSASEELTEKINRTLSHP